MIQPPGEAELVERFLGGDAEAFHSLAQRFYRPVAAFLLRRLGRGDGVEDLVQETFLEAFRALRQGTRPASFSSWLFGVANNRLGKHLRKRRPMLFDPAEPPVTPSVPAPQAALAEAEAAQRQLARLDATLADLPEEIRELLRLKHRDGLTCDQIASRTGKPVGTIKSLLSRTYHQLRERLAPEEEELP